MSAAFILLALSAATATEPHSLGLRSRRGSTRGRSSVAYRLTSYGVNLPSALRLEREDVTRVCRELKNVLHNGSTRPR
jgi:dTDP-4-amino-4,6-dideoxygalactose transaminase